MDMSNLGVDKLNLVLQMLKKNKPRDEIKPVDKEKQKEKFEKSLEAIRRFNQISE